MIVRSVEKIMTRIKILISTSLFFELQIVKNCLQEDINNVIELLNCVKMTVIFQMHGLLIEYY